MAGTEVILKGVTARRHTQRRLWLILAMTVLGAIAGFLWGQQVGIQQGKAAMLKLLEIRLNKPSLEKQLPT